MTELNLKMDERPPVLFVDLDDTLVATDMLAESFLLALRRFPWILFQLPFWLLRGKAHLKQQLAARVQVDVASLPYREGLLKLLRQEQAHGRHLVLATASDHQFAQAIADHLQIFNGVLSSDGTCNLKGPLKQEAIDQYRQEKGFKTFGYVGDSQCDLAIWEYAQEIWLVNPSGRIRRAVGKLGGNVRIIGNRVSLAKAVIRALRPQQWAKNILVFVPLILGHELGDWRKTVASVFAFVAFCLFASSVYVTNDLFDLQADRRHPKKRHRPLASGALPIPLGLGLAGCLLASGLILSFVCLPNLFLIVAGLYLVSNLLYSIWLKQKVIFDVVVLAMMYILRIIGGGVASDILVSQWLLAFALFLFASLAFAKRYSELMRMRTDGDVKDAKGRGYLVADIPLIGSLGPSSGLMAVLVLALYLNSEEVQLIYHDAWLLWLGCPLLLYWISRLWIVAGRGELQEDPVAFTIMDWRSWVVALLMGAVMLFAT
jgi:4-hydroxybenzoate polyprenyltransferase/phosphoserine phosphatase